MKHIHKVIDTVAQVVFFSGFIVVPVLTFVLFGSLRIQDTVSKVLQSVSAVAFADAPPTGGDGDTGTSSGGGADSVPPTGGDGETGAVSDSGSGSGAPPTGDNGDTGGVSNPGSGSGSVPPTGGNGDTGVSGGSSVPPTGGDGETGAVSDSGSGSGAPPTAGGEAPAFTRRGGGGGGFFPFHSIALFGGLRPQVLSASVSQEMITACTEQNPYLKSYIKLGWKNDPEDVKRLQQFLNKHQGANLPVTGFYGPRTFNEVRKFQARHSKAILVPWKQQLGVSLGTTGFVYKTTRRWINILECPALSTTLPVPQLP